MTWHEECIGRGEHVDGFFRAARVEYRWMMSEFTDMTSAQAKNLAQTKGSAPMRVPRDALVPSASLSVVLAQSHTEPRRVLVARWNTEVGVYGGLRDWALQGACRMLLPHTPRAAAIGLAELRTQTHGADDEALRGLLRAVPLHELAMYGMYKSECHFQLPEIELCVRGVAQDLRAQAAPPRVCHLPDGGSGSFIWLDFKTELCPNLRRVLLLLARRGDTSRANHGVDPSRYLPSRDEGDELVVGAQLRQDLAALKDKHATDAAAAQGREDALRLRLEGQREASTAAATAVVACTKAAAADRAQLHQRQEAQREASAAASRDAATTQLALNNVRTSERLAEAAVETAGHAAEADALRVERSALQLNAVAAQELAVLQNGVHRDAAKAAEVALADSKQAAAWAEAKASAAAKAAETAAARAAATAASAAARQEEALEALEKRLEDAEVRCKQAAAGAKAKASAAAKEAAT
jgi:hypothetical protein